MYMICFGISQYARWKVGSRRTFFLERYYYYLVCLLWCGRGGGEHIEEKGKELNQEREKDIERERERER